ncbi:nitrous oxide reductase accessory protein NosL [Thiovibrio frasassiensis]|uniref:Nitrous oxide reductase accessory protein NosL n=1 Tax=Thiovibrio frasassiensis TaxID=2984131 RepID=A0A9X4MIG9_9BACT|nr:nitrous oxide reductase accessory protein NosL [Thiovibrio frasassiensis]MDG4476835.1 nitrous oxide reductase accessory protein NosL [Thiovibrio frasassiensis]
MHPRQTNKPAKPWLIILSISAMLLASPLAFAAPPSAPAAALAPQVISETMHCAACGMFPQRYPQWQSQIIFTDASMAAFDGCKCMFRFLLNMQKFAPERKAEQVAAVWVKDFKSGTWIDGKAAYYVIGSKEMGPMGKELIPFTAKSAAEEFQKANGGSIETYANISMDTIKPLMGGMQMNMPHSPMH